MRWGRSILLVALVSAGLGVAACGDDDESGQEKPEPEETRAAASPMRCLVLSVLSPELYEPGQTEEAGVEKGVKPLLTKGAKGAEILTGQLGAVVIEYPDEAAVSRALRKARSSRTLAQYTDTDRIRTYGRLLYIDYSGERHVRRIVRGCGLRPNEPPLVPQ